MALVIAASAEVVRAGGEALLGLRDLACCRCPRLLDAPMLGEEVEPVDTRSRVIGLFDDWLINCRLG